MQVYALELSPACRVATQLLNSLGITEPPLCPEVVLANRHLTLEELPAFDYGRLTAEQRRIFGSVRALLSPAEKKIYTSPILSPHQLQWAIFHETGHDMIDWHRELLYLDSEYSLSPQVRKLMEKEANEFAGHLQFLGTKLAMEARELPLDLASAILLAHRYNASYESTFRHYVETHQEICICRVFRIVGLAESEQTLQYHYFVKPSGLRRHWIFPYQVGQQLPTSDSFVRLLNQGKLSNGDIIEEMTLAVKAGTVYRHQIFSNGHSVFVLTAPINL